MATTVPTPVENAIAASRIQTLVTLVKENQLVTALVLFLLWQTGALLTVTDQVSGVMC